MANPIDPTQSVSGPRVLDSTIDATRGFGPFTDLTPHARGGFGEVLRGTDPELHRTVAVKRLQDRHADNLGIRQRFLVAKKKGRI